MMLEPRTSPSASSPHLSHHLARPSCFRHLASRLSHVCGVCRQIIWSASTRHLMAFLAPLPGRGSPRPSGLCRSWGPLEATALRALQKAPLQHTYSCKHIPALFRGTSRRVKSLPETMSLESVLSVLILELTIFKIPV